MSTPELLPCPFCGSEAITEWAGYGTQADIVCEDCSCERAVQVRDAPGCKDSEWNETTFRFDDQTIARVNEYLRREWNERSGAHAQQTWQPIETAPPAGTLIDVWMVLPSGHGARWTGVMWGDTRQCWIGGPPSQDANGWKAIHWMPLPAPPVVPDDGQAGGARS